VIVAPMDTVEREKQSPHHDYSVRYMSVHGMGIDVCVQRKGRGYAYGICLTALDTTDQEQCRPNQTIQRDTRFGRYIDIPPLLRVRQLSQYSNTSQCVIEQWTVTRTALISSEVLAAP
jgi:hypothetical protein